MMRMTCSRVTPGFAVRMTMSSVVLGDGGTEAGLGAGDSDCAPRARGRKDIRKGKTRFIRHLEENSFQVWYLSVPCSIRHGTAWYHCCQEGSVMTLKAGRQQNTDRGEIEVR